MDALILSPINMLDLLPVPPFDSYRIESRVLGNESISDGIYLLCTFLKSSNASGSCSSSKA